MTFYFGDIVVVEADLVGVVVKCWADKTYEVYVRSMNGVASFGADDMRRFCHGKEICRDCEN